MARSDRGGTKGQKASSGQRPPAQKWKFAVHGPWKKTLSLQHVATEVTQPGGDPAGTVKRSDELRYRGRLLVSYSEGGTRKDAVSTEGGGEANALIMMRRLAFSEDHDHVAQPSGEHLPPRSDRQWLLRAWAEHTGLGQTGGDGLLRAVFERRDAYLDALSAPAPGTGGGDVPPPRGHVRRLLLRTEWRIAVGLGVHHGMQESGLALHGTYGWPVIPGSALKGVAAAAARTLGADAATYAAVFGTPRPAGSGADEEGLLLPAGASAPEEARVGGVAFLDALPAGAPVDVHEDVITPHQKPYYQSTPACADPSAEDGEPAPGRAVPPAEHHQPEPAAFLSVSGEFRVDLVAADPGLLDTAQKWLARAGDELGIGGRTTAGYGYFDCADRNGSGGR